MPLEEQEIEAIKTQIAEGKFTEHPEMKKLSELGLKLHTESTLESEVSKKAEEVIKPRVREIYTQFENDVKSITGIEKNANEKAYDYVKRVIPEYVSKQQSDELKKLQGEIDTYKKKIEEGDTEGIWKQKLSESETKFKNELEKIKRDLEDERKNTATATKMRLLSEAHSPIKSKYRKDLPSYFYTTERMILDEALKSSVVVKDEKDNDILVEADANGEPKKDSSFNYIPISKKLETALKDAIATDPKKGGAGTGGGGNEPVDPSKITVDTFQMPESIKTKQDLTTHLLELGLRQGDKNFDEIFDKHSGNLKFR